MAKAKYEVTIKEFVMWDGVNDEPRIEPTKRESVYYKTASDFKRIDQLVEEEGSAVIEPAGYVVLAVHNEGTKNERKDYDMFLVVEKNGTVYSTSSENFFSTFTDIFHDMIGEPDFRLNMFALPSKNYQGKKFLTCSLV